MFGRSARRHIGAVLLLLWTVSGATPSAAQGDAQPVGAPANNNTSVLKLIEQENQRQLAASRNADEERIAAAARAAKDKQANKRPPAPAPPLPEVEAIIGVGANLRARLRFGNQLETVTPNWRGRGVQVAGISARGVTLRVFCAPADRHCKPTQHTLPFPPPNRFAAPSTEVAGIPPPARASGSNTHTLTDERARLALPPLTSLAPAPTQLPPQGGR